MKYSAVMIAALLAACGGDTNYYGPDAGAACPASTNECLSDSLARVCPADGSGWLALPCGSGEKCTNGACVADIASVVCTPGATTCTDATHALVCNATGVGLTSMTCPTSTQCIGGQCEGACVVGAGFCLSPTVLSTCADGQTYTTSTCGSGMLCVEGGGGAACLPAECDPSALPCGVACGHKSTNATSTDPGFVSVCAPTSTGYQWESVQCPAPTSCDPNACPQNLIDACTSQCTPGEVRCSANGDATVTCGANGQWGAPTSCDVTMGKSCVQAAGGRIGCGDAVCDNASAGTCVISQGVSKLRACDATGNLVAANTLTTCTTGVCTDTGQPVNGYIPGQCQAQCQAGEQRCVAGSAVQTCATNGVWSSATTACMQNESCFEYTIGVSPQLHAVCGVCDPGSTRCTDVGGAPAGTTAYEEVCGNNAQWGTPMGCVASYCHNSVCSADCQPGSQVCTGGAAGGTPPTSYGRASAATCTADGRVGTSTACATGTSCRRDLAGNAYGCVTCVGTQNEAGAADTRCSDAGGTNPGVAAVQVCKTTNDGWLTPSACPNGTSCIDEQDPRTFQPATCDLTQSTLLQFSLTCQQIQHGPPIACAGQLDCCSNDCNPGTSADPAVCN